jgi:WS/DGAT/MGAT family acyltransferase
MSYTYYERLTALDSLFLEIERPNVHMHVGAIAIFDDCQSLRTPEGALDIERIRSYVAGSIQDAPRFRQKLATVPVIRNPIWIDDSRFKVRYHVRHTALPAPGSLRLLKRLAGRIMSQPLDRAKPMWEMWIVEGLEDNRFALIIKAHHCMVDGVSGIDLVSAILHNRAEIDENPPARMWLPRRHPPRARLLFDEVTRRALAPAEIARLIPRAMRRPRAALEQLRESTLAVAEAVTAGLVRTTPNPLNPDVGPYRKFDWTEFDIAHVKKIREAFGGTLNDVVLATVAGTVGRFLEARGESVTAETVFRALVPVNARKAGDPKGPGNHVVNLFARLPIHEKNPRKRLELVTAITSELKGSRSAAGTETIEHAIDQTFTGLMSGIAQLGTYARAYNLVVTNVPGPPATVYFMGAPLRSIFPVVPLFTNQALGIALFSYAGKLCWGLNADWDSVPDLHDLVVILNEEFAKLCEIAGIEQADVAADRATNEAPRLHPKGASTEVPHGH